MLRAHITWYYMFHSEVECRTGTRGKTSLPQVILEKVGERLGFSYTEMEAKNLGVSTQGCTCCNTFPEIPTDASKETEKNKKCGDRKRKSY